MILKLPSAKMLRFLHLLKGRVLYHTRQVNVEGKLPPVGRTDDVPFVPMEEEATIRAKAAQPDEAQVDTSN